LQTLRAVWHFFNKNLLQTQLVSLLSHNVNANARIAFNTHQHNTRGREREWGSYSSI
jgi:hypothetical protein